MSEALYSLLRISGDSDYVLSLWLCDAHLIEDIDGETEESVGCKVCVVLSHILFCRLHCLMVAKLLPLGLRLRVLNMRSY